MLNYKLICRDADGNPVDSRDVEAATDAKAIDSALEIVQGNIYELWDDTRRVAVIEANDASTVDLTPAIARGPGKQTTGRQPADAWRERGHAVERSAPAR